MVRAALDYGIALREVALDIFEKHADLAPKNHHNVRAAGSAQERMQQSFDNLPGDTHSGESGVSVGFLKHFRIFGVELDRAKHAACPGRMEDEPVFAGLEWLR